jgi:RNA polymerase sigma factor (sigma-70 family)
MPNSSPMSCGNTSTSSDVKPAGTPSCRTTSRTPLQSAYLLFLERYNGVGEPLAWLYTTVKREAWALRRRASRQRECSVHGVSGNQNGDLDLTEALPSDAPDPSEEVERVELLAEQRRALARLKHDERKALWLFGLGLSYAEICGVTGWTHTKVNRCLSEGRSALKHSRSF